MQNNTPKQLDKIDRLMQNFYYWLFFILTIKLCFGYFLSNHTMGLNDIWIEQYTFFHMLYEFKLGNIIESLIGFEYIPFFKEFIGITIYTISITLTVKCFSIYIKGFTYKHSIIFACIAVSFPFAALSFMDLENTINNTMAMLAGVSAALFFCKYFFGRGTKKHIILCYICLFYSISLCINGLIYFYICILFILFKNNYKVIPIIIKMITITFSVITPYILILIILKALMNLKSFIPINIFQYNISTFFNNTIKLFNNFIGTLNYDFASHILGLSIIILIFISIYIAIKRKSFITFILGIFIIILPFTKFIVTGNIDLSYNQYSTYGYVIAITVIMLYDIIGKDNVMRNILIAISILVILNNAREINKIFFIENLKYQNDLNVSKSILYDLKKFNCEDKKIIFIGMLNNINTPNNYKTENDLISESIFNSSKNESLKKSITQQTVYLFFQNNGIEINYNDEYPLKDQTDILNTIKSMPKYPKNGYIKEIGDYLIVKLGDEIPENG